MNEHSIVLKLDANGVAAGIDQTTKSLNDLGLAEDKVAASSARLSKEQKQQYDLYKIGATAAAQATREVAAQAKELETLRSRLDPAYAATQKLAQSQATLSTALKNGSISITEYNSLMAKAGQSISVMDKYSHQFKRTLLDLTPIISGLGLLTLAHGAIQATDQYTKLTSQLKTATNSTSEYAFAMSEVKRISSAAQVDINAIGSLYQRLSLATQASGTSQKEVALITETVSLGLKANGASARESASAMLQLSQSFGSGRMAGEEFNSMAEAAPNVLRALAVSMGVPYGMLKTLASEGKITTEVMVKAFTDPALLAAFQKQAASMRTVSGAMQEIYNKIELLVGTANKASGFSKATNIALDAVGVMIDHVTDKLKLGIALWDAYFSASKNISSGKIKFQTPSAEIDHDLLFVTKKYDELLAQFKKGDIVQWQLTAGIKKMYEELSPKAEKASSEVTSWVKKLDEQAASIAGVAEEGRKLTKSETEYNDLIVALNSHKDKQLNLIGEELMAKAQLNIAGEAANIANAEAIKLAEKQAEEMKKINAHGITQIDNLDKQIAAQQLHNDSIGKTAEQIAIEKTKAEELLIVKMEIEARDLSGAATSDAVAATKLANLEAEIVKAKELRNLKAEAAPLEAAAAIAKRESEAQKKLWHDIDGFAHTAFNNIMMKGKNAFAEIGKAIKESILDMLYKMTVQRWIFQISGVASLGGASGLAGAADMIGGGSGGTGSWLSAGKSIYDGFSGAFTYSSTATTGLSGMFNSFATSSLGQSMGLSNMGTASQYVAAANAGTSGAQISSTGSTLGTAGSYVGAGIAGITLGTMIAGDKVVLGMDGKTTSAIGAAIGLALNLSPLGLLAGGIVGGLFSAAFGMGPKQSGTTTLAGSFGQGGFAGNYQTPWTQKGGWFRSDKSGTDIQGVPQAQSEAFKNVIAGTQSVFSNLISASGDAQKSLTGWTFAINRQVATEEQQKQLVIDIATSMGNFLIPSLEQFKQKGEDLADTAVRMRDEFILTDSILRMVGGSFGLIGLASMGARDNLVQLMGGIQGMSTTMQSYYHNFFTDAERHANDLGELTIKFAQLGLVIPQTSAEFRKLVEGQDLSTESGRKMFAALMSLQGAFTSVIPAAQQLITAWQSVTDSIYQEIARIRGLLSGGTILGAQSRFDIATEQARLGNQDAAKSLPNLSNAVLDIAKNTSTSAIELARYQARIANSLSITATLLSGKYGTVVPQFAIGGAFGGGLRIVGENGPELEATGPSTIISNSNTRSLLNNDSIVAELKALREEVQYLRSENRAGDIAIERNTQKTAKILDKFDGQGLPSERLAA